MTLLRRHVFNCWANSHVAALYLALGMLALHPLHAKSWYVSCSGAGSRSGRAAENPAPVTWFNCSANWGNQSGQIGPGDNVYLSGIFDTPLQIQGSGAPGRIITILFDKGAELRAAYWPTGEPIGTVPAAGAITLHHINYVTIDGGTNGSIICTDNGFNGGTHWDCVGIFASGCSHLTIERLNIKNLYVREAHSEPAGKAFGYRSTGIFAEGVNYFTDLLIRDCYFHDVARGIYFDYADSGLGTLEISHNTFSRTNWGIGSGNRSPNAIASTISIHDNSFSDWSNWDDPGGNAFHHNAVYLFSTGATTYIKNYRFYNNRVGPGYGAYQTSGLFLGGNYLHCVVYNNIFTSSFDDVSHPKDGMLYGSLGRGTRLMKCYLLNNTFVGCNRNDMGMYLNYGLSAARGSAYVVANNLFSNCSINIADLNNGNRMILLSDHNLFSNSAALRFVYSDNGSFHFINVAQWRRRGFDVHGVETAAHLTAQFVPVPPSGAIGAGLCLASFFNFDALNRPRPRNANWDIGAIQH